MPKEFILEKFDSGMHYIMLDKKTVATLTKDNNKRAICKLNNQLEFHCAIMPKKEGGHFINIGSTICKKLKIKEGSKISATFSVDKTEYQFEMPEELKEVLNTDQEADEIFHSLTEGNQRGLIYLVGQVKSSDKKIERALKIVERLKIGVTSPRVILK
ncbi:MAG: YdeI/OmpD-associated family protein [Ignavibacteria bacterium]|nr:YdeI/OmpD-associated family protein [Ignavibacteria bacterium]